MDAIRGDSESKLMSQVMRKLTDALRVGIHFRGLHFAMEVEGAFPFLDRPLGFLGAT